MTTETVDTTSGVDSSGGTVDGGTVDSSGGTETTEGGIEPAPLEEGELRPGGDTTTESVGADAFLQRAANLSAGNTADFEAGLQFVLLDWEPAPGQAEIDGLGPTYNAVSCIACHVGNGRSPVPSRGDPNAPGLLLRLGSDTAQPDPNYGGQLQPLAIAGVPAEGAVAWTDEPPLPFAFDDGTALSLVRRAYFVDAPSWGPLAPGIGVSARLPQQMVGMGLLEAIDAADVVAWADPDDLDGDGISGRAAWLDDRTLGRFGWKATQPTVEHQSAAAFAGDLGLTSEYHPDENCPPSQVECAAAPNGGSPELSPTRLRLSGFYVRLLGVPQRRDGDSLDVRRGKTVFFETGCGECHRPSYTTGDTLEAELSSQRIWPYTDLLLHDMGDGLADEVAEGVAQPQEWRTPPLWGVGLLSTVNGDRALLHDGRAASLEEAIAWHGGEGEAARQAYQALSAEERALLHLFVDSL